MKKPFPFQKMWFGVDLGEIRPIDATYGGEDFDALPTISQEHLDGSFSYLDNDTVGLLDERIPDGVDKPFKASAKANIFETDSEWQEKLKKIQDSLPPSLKLPEGLLKFMSSPEAHSLIPSCTACYFDLPETALPFKWLGEEGFIFHFYRDQQDCLFWYFYIRNTGESCILTSPIPILPEEQELLDTLSDEAIQRDTFYTAASFEEFIYRTWIENMLWFDMEGEMEEAGSKTKQLCQEYIDHYKK